MKKFFTRFASNGGGDKGGVENGGFSKYSSSGGEAIVSEKPGLQAGEKSGRGQRVKTLAARFESLHVSESKQQQQQNIQQQSPQQSIDLTLQRRPPTAPPHRSGSKNYSRPNRDEELDWRDSTLLASQGASTQSTAAANVEAVLPSETTKTTEQANAAPHDACTLPARPSEEEKADDVVNKEKRARANGVTPPGGSSSIASTSQLQQPSSNPKVVAFAPSPKKPIRPQSPRYTGNEDEFDESLQATSLSYTPNHFAKATNASAAKAKSTATARNNSIDGGVLAASTSNTNRYPSSTSVEGGTISRPSSALSGTRPQARRSVSSSGPNRAVQTNADHLDSSAIGYATASSASLTQAASEAVLHLPNSIPFVSSVGSALIRSASPQSTTTNSSRPTGNYLASGLSSRRGSWTGNNLSSGSMNQGWASSGARSVGGPSWSEMTQEDLVCNLGVRERTRQEVLWEIVASEERYVRDLERIRDLYLDALLHPLRYGPTRSATLSNDDNLSRQRHSIGTDRGEDLPIAARFMTAGFANTEGVAASISARSDKLVKDDEIAARTSTTPTVSSPLMKEQKMKRGNNPKRWSNSRTLAKKEAGSAASSQAGYGIGDGSGISVSLPASLKITMEAILNGLIEAHTLLSEALKQRYEDQWPLVRSLADVFSRYAYVWQYYKDYVLHLERALDCLEEATLMERAMRGKRIKKEKLPVSVSLGRAIASLEIAAAERSECSLAIFLAMPFQRLLKYPLLFQNLLFHTDASTYEFESTVKMVVDIEAIVRSIEDEKADKEERDKVIDAFARVEGIKDRALLRPKRDRLLIEERALYEESPRRAISDSNENANASGLRNGGKGNPVASLTSHNALSTATNPNSLRKSLKDKRSYRRLSDFLMNDDRQKQATKAPNMGSKKDLWIVRFSDVEIRCQRVGVTALPMVSSVALQQPSGRDVAKVGEGDHGNIALTEEEMKIKEDFKRTKESNERMRALRSTTLRSKTRNLYRFLSVVSWKQVQRSESMDVERLEGLASPQEVDEEDEEDEGDDDDDGSSSSRSSAETDVGMLDTKHYVRQSKLSFSYWGQDRVDPKPLPAVTRTQSQYSSFVAPFRSVDQGKMKRHSLTSAPTAGGSFSTQGTALMSSFSSPSARVVTSNSHARAKMDKFGTRLRPGSESDSPSQAHRISSSRPAPQIVDKNADSEGGQRHTPSSTHEQASDLPSSSSSTGGGLETDRPRRPTFARDASIDSNLKLVGLLISEGERGAGVWR